MKETENRGVSAWHVVALCVALAALALMLCVTAVSRHRAKGKLVEAESAFLDSLHVFPEIQFADSLYAMTTMEKYDNENPKVVYYFVVDSNGVPTNERVHETHLYENEQKYIDGNLKSDKRDGLWYAYHPDGTVQTKAFYKDGKEDGRYTVFYSNGNVRYTGVYSSGRRVGEWRFYDEDGKLSYTKMF